MRGLRELNRAFNLTGKDLKKELRDEIKAVGEPVRQLAEAKAVSEIRNVGVRWSGMRLGVTTKVGYVAPKARRRGGSPRPKFGTLLMERAMLPALAQSEPMTIRRFDAMIDRLADKAGF